MLVEEQRIVAIHNNVGQVKFVCVTIKGNKIRVGGNR